MIQRIRGRAVAHLKWYTRHLSGGEPRLRVLADGERDICL